MDGCVDHKPVETLSHSRISDRLELARMALICPPAVPFSRTAVSGESLGGADVLAIYMGNG